jgi:hypothetical protein
LLPALWHALCMRYIWLQEPLPFPGDGVYNLGVPPSAGHSDPEDLHVVVAYVVQLLADLERAHPGVLDAAQAFLSTIESGD